ncbi:MAG: histidine phosphatase family protein [Cyclobacteriaceae bacterium]|nr:histidine phosphatase family protein [Cyclobacteriaceae bacterium]
MTKFLLTPLLILFAINLSAQDKLTTFILIRHAEKDMTQSTNDPDLSAEGKKRSERLAALLNEGEVNAIYSTPYKRTRQTVELLAKAKGLSINDYQVNKEEEIDRMITSHAGGTIVVSGHSNTIPWFANKLLGYEKYRPWEDGDYDNVLLITVTERGKLAKLVWLNY